MASSLLTSEGQKNAFGLEGTPNTIPILDPCLGCGMKKTKYIFFYPGSSSKIPIKLKNLLDSGRMKQISKVNDMLEIKHPLHAFLKVLNTECTTMTMSRARMNHEGRAKFRKLPTLEISRQIHEDQENLADLCSSFLRGSSLAGRPPSLLKKTVPAEKHLQVLLGFRPLHPRAGWGP